MKKVIKEYAVITANLLYQAAESLAGPQGCSEIEIRVELDEESEIIVNEEEGEYLEIPLLVVYGKDPKTGKWHELEISDEDLFGQCHLELMNAPGSVPFDFMLYGEPLFEHLGGVLPKSRNIEVGLLLVGEEKREA